MKEPLYAAHRGYSSRAPENTIPAFEEAVKAGFGAVECDIWEGKGERGPEFFVFHDETLKRMCGADVKTAELTKENVSSFPVISGSRIQSYGGALKIPSLEEYLETLAPSRAVPIIEIKGNSRLTENGAELLMKTIYGRLSGRQIILQSFGRENLRKVRPYIKEGTELFLLAKKRGALNRQRLEEYKKEGIHGLSIKYTLAALLPEIKACALKTAVWTVNFRVQAAHLIKTGKADILISNRKLFI